MMLSSVERALGMLRVYLVESVTQNNWSDHHTDELAQTIAACLRQATEQPQHKTTPEHGPKLARDVLRRAIRFVNDNLDSKLRWDDIATACGVDPFAFGRGFKLTSGMTPHQYIIRCRLRRAMKLLAREELTLADIALDVGCSCQSHLTTLFRKHLGTTPAAFRVSARKREGNGRASPWQRWPMDAASFNLSGSSRQRCSATRSRAAGTGSGRGTQADSREKDRLTAEAVSRASAERPGRSLAGSAGTLRLRRATMALR